MKRLIFNGPNSAQARVITPVYLGRGGPRCRRRRPGILIWEPTKSGGLVVGEDGELIEEPVTRGWVVVYRTEDDEIVEERNLTVSDVDIIFPDGSSIFNETPDEFLERIRLDCVPSGLESFIIDDADPESLACLNEHISPSNPYFRNAMVVQNGVLTCNMPKARAIHLEHIRDARNAKFERLGLDRRQQTAIALGDPVEARSIEAQKQTLRDIPQTFDLLPYTTPEELKAAWPKEL